MASAQAVIQVQDLRKSYGETRAVDGLSFTVQPGEVFGMLGPNGAGKTTTVECIEGLQTMVGYPALNPLWLDFTVLSAWLIAFVVLSLRFFRWHQT